MAFLTFDSFRTYDDTQFEARGIFVSTVRPSIVSHWVKMSDSRSFLRWGPARLDLTVSFKYRTPSSSLNTNADHWLVSTWSNGNNDFEGAVKLKSDGKLEIWCRQTGHLTLMASTSAGVITANNAQYTIEFRWRIGVSDGAYALAVNGITLLSASSVNTNPIGLAAANDSFYLGTADTGGGYTTDDWYTDMMYGRGDTSPVFYGKLDTAVKVPTGAGHYTQWTPSTGANWQDVDEIPPNGDTDYISTMASAIDTYVYSPLPVGASSTIICVASCQYIKGEAGFVWQSAVYWRIGGVDHPRGFLPFKNNTTYFQVADQDLVSPATGVAWTVAELNAAEMGTQAHLAGTPSTGLRSSQCVMEIIGYLRPTFSPSVQMIG